MKKKMYDIALGSLHTRNRRAQGDDNMRRCNVIQLKALHLMCFLIIENDTKIKIKGNADFFF